MSEETKSWFNKKEGYHYRETTTFDSNGKTVREHTERQPDSWVYFLQPWETVKDIHTTRKK